MKSIGRRKRGCNKEGVCNANKCAHTKTNANFRLSERYPNADKAAQTQANADKREQMQNQRITPPFTHPLLRQPKSRPISILTNPGTTPITISAVNSDHGLSFAGEETRTMVWVSFSLQSYSTFWILAVQLLRGLLSFLILRGWGWFPHRQYNADSWCNGRNAVARSKNALQDGCKIKSIEVLLVLSGIAFQKFLRTPNTWSCNLWDHSWTNDNAEQADWHSQIFTP